MKKLKHQFFIEQGETITINGIPFGLDTPVIVSTNTKPDLTNIKHTLIKGEEIK